MATATAPELKSLWLNDFENPADSREFPFLVTLQRAETAEGDRRIYGNGRKRVYTSVGENHDWEVALQAVSPEDASWLSRHKKRPLIARDDRGHRIFATYWALPFDEHSYNEESDVSFRLTEITETLVV